MPVATAKIFRNGRNQAVRIPVEFSFDTNTVTIEKRGEALILKPHRDLSWDEFFDDESMVLPEDFELPQDPPPQDREGL